MSMTLMEALAEVDLTPGQTYRCVVKDCRVVLQVFPEPPFCDTEVPVEDPFEHPFPTPFLRTKVCPGPLPLPDPLELSLEDFEEPSA